jgi:tRNA(Ile)-lysidine synthase
MPLGHSLAGATMARADAGVLDFAALMAPFAPFEPQRHLAVAVSGGGDSMALALLAHDWAAARGGRITALTVDHGLRAAAATEAAQVAAWCKERGIAHVILTRSGAAPDRGVQAFARAARYALLEEWCRAHAVLHLLLGHQRDDQAETAAIRDAAGSGLDGLAGMASVSERAAVRLLRPLLPVPRERLREFLAARGQPWIEDPSNRNRAFTRVRVRVALGRAGLGSSDAHRAATARRLGAARAAREAADARHLGLWVMLHPAGFAVLDPRGLAGADALGIKAFGAVLMTISGGVYPPRRARIERLYGEIAAGLAQGRTLGGCLILPQRGKVLVCREPEAVALPLPLVPGGEVRWDGRFRVALDPVAPAGLAVGALGRDGPAVARDLRESAAAPLPAAIRWTLPALRDAKGVVAVPSLGYFRGCREKAENAACRVQFRPCQSLTGAGFTIV